MPSIKYKKKTYAGSSVPVLEMTKAQYDALPVAKQNDGTIYLITDDDGGWEAERSVYDNSDSGLTATNVQGAVDEIANRIPFQLHYSQITHTIGDLTQGARGYTTVTVPSNLVGKTVLAVTINIGHPAGSNGLQVSGGAYNKLRANMYLNYYAPVAVQGNQTDLWITILWTD